MLLPRITWLGDENSGGPAPFLVITVTMPPPRAEFAKSGLPAAPRALESGNPAVATLVARTTALDGCAVLVERMTELGINGGGTPMGNMVIEGSRQGDAKSGPAKPYGGGLEGTSALLLLLPLELSAVTLDSRINARDGLVGDTAMLAPDRRPETMGSWNGWKGI